MRKHCYHKTQCIAELDMFHWTISANTYQKRTGNWQVQSGRLPFLSTFWFWPSILEMLLTHMAEKQVVNNFRKTFVNYHIIKVFKSWIFPSYWAALKCIVQALQAQLCFIKSLSIFFHQNAYCPTQLSKPHCILAISTSTKGPPEQILWHKKVPFDLRCLQRCFGICLRDHSSFPCRKNRSWWWIVHRAEGETSIERYGWYVDYLSVHFENTPFWLAFCYLTGRLSTNVGEKK